MDELYIQEDTLEPIAIIGMAGRFPGAKNLEEFWCNLRDGVESITFFSDEEAIAAGTDPELLKNPAFVKAHGVLDDMELFDATFFDMSPRDAKLLDPQHRIYLECAWESLEDAGYNPETYVGRIGVYAGTSFSTYLLRNILPNKLVNFPTIDRLEMALTNHKDTMPMRVSFHMNLTGPSICVGTTCSTALVAVHLACQALWTYQCDMAIVGASFLRVPSKEGYLFQEGMIYSPDGHLRTFDIKSKGIVTGAGTGNVVLKLLSQALADGDNIHAVIKATALNNDGSTKVGYTAPSIGGQAEVISEAMSLAGVTAETMTFIETHGTGTELGDPVEIAALKKAFRMTASDADALPKHYCGLASTKPNIGHLNHAAGIASLIKTILALKHKQIPPTINFETPNPKLGLEDSPFYINDRLSDWIPPPGLPRRAGVNGFGIGGTNAHVVVEEAPELEASGPSRAWQIILISAKTSTALDTLSANLARHLRQFPHLNLADLAYTLNVGRKPLPFRRMVLCQTLEQAATALESHDPKRITNSRYPGGERPVTFMFSGQGSQYVNMARELYNTEAVFRQHLDRCFEIGANQGLKLREILYPNNELNDTANVQLQQTAVTQPALFAIEYALAQMWMTWGIYPESMIGHSIGEYVAACVAGVFSLEDALALVITRGRMMQEMPTGAMLSVALPEAEIVPLLGNDLALCVLNGPAQCVIGGETTAVDLLEQKLIAQSVDCRRLYTSHAFHSPMMAPMMATFTQQVAQMLRHPPQIPYISNVTGTWITPEQAMDPTYWAQHLRHPVRFAAGVQGLLQDPRRVLLEVGPGRTLSTLVKQQTTDPAAYTVLTSVRHPQENTADEAFLLNTLGRLWLAGILVDWPAFYTEQKRRRLPLPTYPFERKRYWIDPPQPGEGIGFDKPQLSLSMLGRDNLEVDETDAASFTEYVAPRNAKEEEIAAVWRDVLNLRRIGIHENFFELGGSSLLGSRVVAELCKAMNIELSVPTFLNAPTIAELAELIEDRPEDSELAAKPAADKIAPLPVTTVKLRGGDDHQPPLFLVHAIDGFVFFYRDLANALAPGRRVYAFQAQGLEPGTAPLTRIEDMATWYIKALRSIQAQGPYRLGGVSFGGAVALEMAQQLRVAGESVQTLFLSDTPPTDYLLFNLKDDTAILQFVVKYLLKWDDSGIKWDILREQSLETQVKNLLTQPIHAETPFSLSANMLQRLVCVIRTHQQALRAYTPKPYMGRMIFFRPTEALENAQLGAAEQFWLRFAQGGMEINNVPGNHLSMNFQPNVQTVANDLNRHLG